MISIRTPQRDSAALTNSAAFVAARSPAVPTAAIATAPASRASSASAAIASSVRSIGSGPSAPVASRPSPSRVTIARSMTTLQVSSARRSPTWSLTELVPTSITACRTSPKLVSTFSPRTMHTFARASSPNERTAAITRAGSSDSIASERVEPSSVSTSQISALQPPTA